MFIENRWSSGKQRSLYTSSPRLLSSTYYNSSYSCSLRDLLSVSSILCFRRLSEVSRAPLTTHQFFTRFHSDVPRNTCQFVYLHCGFGQLNRLRILYAEIACQRSFSVNSLIRVPCLLRKKGTLIRSFSCPCLSACQESLSQERLEISSWNSNIFLDLRLHNFLKKDVFLYLLKKYMDVYIAKNAYLDWCPKNR